MQKLYKLIIFIIVLAFSVSSYAQLRIEIRQGLEAPLRIAMPIFYGDLAINQMLKEVIESDLENSGRFQSILDSQMISRPTLPEDVNINDWRLIDSDYLLIGQTEVDSANNLRIAFQLFDVLRGEQIIGFRLATTIEEVRLSAHRIADLIYEDLLGVQGVFSTKIAYISEDIIDEVTHYQIVIADVDGTDPFVVIDSTEPLMSPAWSPDGRKIAYVSFENNQSEIIIQDVSTGFREQVSSREGINGAPSFSPDGSRLALTLSGLDGNLDIYMLNLQSQSMIRLTDSVAIDTESTWSPDSRFIYFTSDRTGNPQIYRVQAIANGDIERVTFEGNYNTRARLAPNGESMAVVHQINGDYRIALVDLETRITQVLSDGQLDESPSFAPNGDLIMFATRDRGVGVLSSVSLDGRIYQRIASVGEDVREPAWSPYALR